MYSTHDQGKYIVADTFIRTLKDKTYKYIPFISKMLILINYMT